MMNGHRLTACFLIIALAVANIAWTPWGAIYESAMDERSVTQQADDKRISLDIKGKMANIDKGKAYATKTYCFVGHVFLVGAVNDKAFRAKAVQIAKSIDGVKKVTTHFVNESDTTADDLEIAAKVRTELIADTSLSSTQIETETMNGEVVLVGMVSDKKDVSIAKKIAKGVTGVKKVKSYLIVTK